MNNNEQFIKLSKWFMILSGFWDKPVGTNPLINKIIAAYSIIIKLIYVMFWISLTAELFRLIIQNYDTSIIMSSLGVVVNATKIQAKIIIFLKNGLVDLFDYVMQKEKEIWQSYDQDVKKLYSKKVKFCRNFMIAQALASFCAVSALNLIGIYGNLKLMEHNRSYNTSLETHLMYQIWFPVTKLEHPIPYYSIMFIFAWAGFIYSSITHMMFITLLIFGAVQLEMLQIKLRKVIDRTKPLIPSDSTKMLKKLILEHKDAIEFIKELNNQSMNIVMMEFILSSMDVASVAANLINGNVSDLGWMFLFFVLLSLQIFALAWNANEIKIQSLAISDAMFESDWYLMDKEGRQLTHIIIMRAQIPLAITIGPFGPMTTQSALLMFKAAYSYVSIMK